METADIDHIESPLYDALKTPYEVDQIPFPINGTIRETYIHLLRYATLAPSSHNAQPWKFQLFDQGIAIRVDSERRLPVSDPYDRELLMGIGTCIMNLRIAARHFGYDVQMRYSGDGVAEDPIAFAALSPRTTDPTRDEQGERLFHSMAKRHTNRHHFLLARVPESVLTRVRDISEHKDVSVSVSTDALFNTNVARLVAEAERKQQDDTEYRKELAGWLRPNNTHETDGITGAAFGVSDAGSTLASWAMRTLDVGSFRAKHDERLCAEAPALLVLSSEDAIPVWVAVGEVLEKTLLTLTCAGVQYSFFNMPIEEPDFRLRVRQMFGLKAWPQLLLRIGYSLEKAVPTPRRQVEDCIVGDF